MKKNKNLKKIIFGFLILITGIITLIFSITYNPKKSNNQNINQKLTGRELVYAQEETIEIIKKYLNQITILEYAKQNKLSSISILTLKEKFNLDISEFNNLTYNCNNQTTTINFNLDYTNYYINLDCLAFYSKK